MPKAARDKPLELWWQVEARVGQQGTLTRLWAERGSRPAAPRDQRYGWAYIFGAVRPARDIGAAVVLPYVNAEAMNLHLVEISRRVAAGSHAVVLLDGAGWDQVGGKLLVPDNINLLHLPPYSPELNPAENVWQFMRQNHLSNHGYETYDDIIDASSDRPSVLLHLQRRSPLRPQRLSGRGASMRQRHVVTWPYYGHLLFCCDLHAVARHA